MVPPEFCGGAGARTHAGPVDPMEVMTRSPHRLPCFARQPWGSRLTMVSCCARAHVFLTMGVTLP